MYSSAPFLVRTFYFIDYRVAQCCRLSQPKNREKRWLGHLVIYSARLWSFRWSRRWTTGGRPRTACWGWAGRRGPPSPSFFLVTFPSLTFYCYLSLVALLFLPFLLLHFSCSLFSCYLTRVIFLLLPFSFYFSLVTSLFLPLSLLPFSCYLSVVAFCFCLSLLTVFVLPSACFLSLLPFFVTFTLSTLPCYLFLLTFYCYLSHVTFLRLLFSLFPSVHFSLVP